MRRPSPLVLILALAVLAAAHPAAAVPPVPMPFDGQSAFTAGHVQSSDVQLFKARFPD